jgi:hypothetical protein
MPLQLHETQQTLRAYARQPLYETQQTLQRQTAIDGDQLQAAAEPVPCFIIQPRQVGAGSQGYSQQAGSQGTDATGVVCCWHIHPPRLHPPSRTCMLVNLLGSKRGCLLG